MRASLAGLAALGGVLAATPASAGPIELAMQFALLDETTPLTVRAVFDEADAVIGAGDASLLFDDFANEGETLSRTLSFSFEGPRGSSAALDVSAVFRALFVDLATEDGGSLFAPDALIRVWSASFDFFATDAMSCPVGLTASGAGYGYDAGSGDCAMSYYDFQPAVVTLRRLDSDPTGIPEPATMALLGLGMLGLTAARRASGRAAGRA